MASDLSQTTTVISPDGRIPIVSARSRGVGVIVALLIISSAVAGTVVATDSPGPASQQLPQLTNTSDDGSNTTNVTVPHQNPAEIDMAGNDERVAGYLATRLGARLNASAIAISNQDYEEGQAPLGEEYDVLLEQYGAVAGDIDAEQTARRFNLTREQQRQIIESAQELNQTGAAYQRAVENGNDEQAQQLARELLETAAEINSTATSLEQQYTALEAETGVELNATRAAISDSQQQVAQAAGAIAQREFTQTAITVETNRSTVSTTTPMTVSGQLTSAGNEPIGNATIVVGIENDTVTTQTAQDGSFNTTYRPIRAPITASTLSVRYNPAPTAPYLGVTETRNVSITTQSDTELIISNSSASAAFGEAVRATARVRVPARADRDLDGIPIVFSIGDQRLATATTNTNGTVSLATPLPARVPTGATELAVAIDRQDLAIASSTATTPVTVEPTATALSVDADTNTTASNVTVTGQLSTASGEPLAGRELRVTLDDVVLGVVETDETGAYDGNVTLPETAGRTGDLTVAFDGSETSLTSSTATQQLSLTASGWGRLNTGLGVGLLVVGLAAVLLARLSGREWGQQLWARIARTTGDTPATADAGSRSSVSNPLSTGVSGDDSPPDGESLAHARTALAAGHPNAAVQIAYGTVRQQLQAELDQPAETHWEFYDRWQRSHADSEQLRRLTELYETAAFSQQDISADTAADIVSIAQDRF